MNYSILFKNHYFFLSYIIRVLYVIILCYHTKKIKAKFENQNPFECIPFFLKYHELEQVK